MLSQDVYSPRKYPIVIIYIFLRDLGSIYNINKTRIKGH